MSISKDQLEMLTVADVARALKLSQRTVHRMIDEGDLAVVRIRRAIRVHRSTLAALVGAPERLQKPKQTNDS